MKGKPISSNFFSSKVEPTSISVNSNHTSNNNERTEKMPDVSTQSSKEQSSNKNSNENQQQQKPDTTTVSSTPRKPLQIPDSVNINITQDNLSDYVGPAIYQKDRLYSRLPPAGVSTGLGYLGNGSGAVMPIECRVFAGKGSLVLTGKLGEVIRESAQIALSWVRSNALQMGLVDDITKPILHERDVHLHMPEGAIGKDGPSAGTAITTAFVSLLTGLKVDPDLAMTGEVTLVGQVCAVGGLREKLLASKRAGVKRVLVPQACKADVDANVPQSVKEGLDIVFVEELSEVLKYAFGVNHHLTDKWVENGIIKDNKSVDLPITSQSTTTSNNEVRLRV